MFHQQRAHPRGHRRPTLDAEGPLDLVPTFLGGHEVPPEYADRRDAYVDLLCNEQLPRVVKLSAVSDSPRVRSLFE